MNGFTQTQIMNFLNFLKEKEEITDDEYSRLTEAIQDKDIWMSASDVAEWLNISKRTVIRYAKKGIFHSYKIGDTARYRKSEIIEALGPLQLGDH